MDKLQRDRWTYYVEGQMDILYRGTDGHIIQRDRWTYMDRWTQYEKIIFINKKNFPMQLFQLFFRQNLAYLSQEVISKVSLKQDQQFLSYACDRETQS